jgi:catechol 2,3-dioxygenase-like lactoylglutathione lyase family enzyme
VHNDCYTADMEGKVIAILRVQDAATAVAWYERLGFRETFVHRFEPGFPAFVTIERGSMKLFLSEHKGGARLDTLICLQVADVRPIAKEFRAEVEDAHWRFEIEIHGPAANRLRIGTPKQQPSKG